MKNHSIKINDKLTVVELGEVLTSNDIKEFDKDLESLMNSVHHVIVDFNTVDSISHDWIRSLLRLQMGLKKKKLQMRIVHASVTVRHYLKTEGVDTAFTMYETMNDAIQDIVLVPKPTLNTDFINPFLDATLRVLDVQANVKAKAGKIVLKKNWDEFTGDISGIIGIVSDSFNGSVVISFPEKTFLKIISSMLGEEYHEINKDILDGAGEITNMIFGQAKVTLNEKGYGIKIALPSVVHGKNHSLSSQTQGPIVVIPFESSAGIFHVEICLSA